MVAKKYQNPSGGLNEAGRRYFKRTTGANLKRPSKKVGNKRRASFCARMKGMKKKLTSAKTANDPNSRINKALRRWNCSYEPTGTIISENLDENKLTRYMAKKAAKQVLGASSKLFSGKKSQGAKFLKKTVQGKNIRQDIANTLRGNKGVGITHSYTKNTPAARRTSEFATSKVEKQMNQMAGRFISGAKSGENYKAYQSPNKSYKIDHRATAKKVGGKDMLKQFDDLTKKSYDRDIRPSDAANVLKKKKRIEI